MQSIDALLGNDKKWKVESNPELYKGFIVTHKETGLWVECSEALNIVQAKIKLEREINYLKDNTNKE